MVSPRFWGPRFSWAGVDGLAVHSPDAAGDHADPGSSLPWIGHQKGRDHGRQGRLQGLGHPDAATDMATDSAADATEDVTDTEGGGGLKETAGDVWK